MKTPRLSGRFLVANAGYALTEFPLETHFMSTRVLASVLLALATVLVTGCAGQSTTDHPPVVHRPLLAHLLDNDVVAPRAPPPSISEPAQFRQGYIRVRPYWKWDGHDFVAVPGEWIKERADFRYSDAYWEQHGDGWHFRPAVWYSL
jgi:hypothetical protein